MKCFPLTVNKKVCLLPLIKSCIKCNNYDSLLKIDVPGLLEELKETMKGYVELEYKCADLKSEKQKVAQDVIKEVSDGNEEHMNLDDISQVNSNLLSPQYSMY